MLLASAVVIALAGCGGRSHALVVVPSADRLTWASEFGSTIDPVADPTLVASVQRAARASGAEPLDVTVVAWGTTSRRHAPAVTLEVDDPAAYLKHRLRGFLDRIGYEDRLGFVEVVDNSGRFVWSAGRFPSGGMVHPRPDLDACGPISHSSLILAVTPPCPAT